MNNLKVVVEWVMCILVAFVFYKNATKKIQVIFSFYKSLEEYRFFNDGLFLKIMTSLIVSAELVTAVIIIIPQVRVLVCFLGIAIQLFYFGTLIINYNKSFDYNCGCYSINAPKHVDFRGIIINQLFLFIFVSIILLKF